jgi:hypothetical protein
MGTSLLVNFLYLIADAQGPWGYLLRLAFFALGARFVLGDLGAFFALGDLGPWLRPKPNKAHFAPLELGRELLPEAAAMLGKERTAASNKGIKRRINSE